ncbi:MAG: family 20 glycosylhydrolase [Fimbriimonadales bacterium]
MSVLAAIVLSSSVMTLPPLIPMPSSVRVGSGTVALDANPTVYHDEACAAEAKLLASELGSKAVQSSERHGGGIDLRLDSSPSFGGKEAYELEVRSQGVFVTAKERAGVFLGTRTVRQLLNGRRELPWMQISDSPRFAWRGMHLDCSRHFYSVEETKKYIDYLAEYKFNVFHWHLVDDGGWRIEIKKYPKLTSIGAWRTELPVVWDYSKMEFPGPDSGKKLYGGFYTQKQIREVVAYAMARHITVVPEIELPGHNLPAMIAYPETGCNIEKGEGRPYRVNAYCAGKEGTFQFLEDVLDETMELFPSKIIHIGGDEVDKYYWARCPDCAKRLATEGLKDLNELQSYFVRRIENYLNKKGRTLMGWDEILEGGLAPNAMVMSWRGEAGGIAAAKSGHTVVMSPTSHCYFDYSYDGTSTKHVYGYEPVPKELTAEEGKLVLGAQANVWTEWIPDFNRVETMIFPRMLAMAEVLWTPKSLHDFENFSQRLQPYYGDFVKRGIDFYVEPPTTEVGLIYFSDKCSVTFKSASAPGTELRYTTDGTLPTDKSPAYSGPIEISKECVVTASYVRNGKSVDRPVTVTCRKTALVVNRKEGIAYEVFRGSFSKLPDFSKLAAEASGVMDAFSIKEYESWPTFAMRFRATLVVPADGLYQFTLGSDDGSALRIGGALVVDNDFAQAHTERSGSAYLMKGEYDLEVGYFEQGGAHSFEAFVKPPGGTRMKLSEMIARAK